MECHVGVSRLIDRSMVFRVRILHPASINRVCGNCSCFESCENILQIRQPSFIGL